MCQLSHPRHPQALARLTAHHTNHPRLRLLMYFEFSPDVGKQKEYQIIHRISLTYMWEWSDPLIRFNVQLGRFASLKRKNGQALVSHFGDGEDLSGDLGNAWNNMTVLAGSNICTFNVKTILLVDDCRCRVHTIACPFDNKHVCFIRQFGKIWCIWSYVQIQKPAREFPSARKSILGLLRLNPLK